MERTRPEDFRREATRPFTGDEYLESLDDGREVCVEGERVAHHADHPAFRNGPLVARLYDALHDPKTKDTMTSPTDTGSSGYTHSYFRKARSRRGTGRAARRYRSLGAHDLRLDGPQPGL